MLELSQRCASYRPVVLCLVTPRNLLDVPTFGPRTTAGPLRCGLAAPGGRPAWAVPLAPPTTHRFSTLRLAGMLSLDRTFAQGVGIQRTACDACGTPLRRRSSHSMQPGRRAIVAVMRLLRQEGQHRRHAGCGLLCSIGAGQFTCGPSADSRRHFRVDAFDRSAFCPSFCAGAAGVNPRRSCAGSPHKWT